jgi:hypothetical protein
MTDESKPVSPKEEEKVNESKKKPNNRKPRAEKKP